MSAQRRQIGIIKLLVYALWLGAVAIPATAWNGGYSDGFEVFAAVPQRLIQTCPVEVNGFTIRASCRWKERDIVLDLESSDSFAGTLTIDDVEYGPVPEPGASGAEVYVTDVNRDQVPDFFLVMPGGGVGLASEYCSVLVAWSQRRDNAETPQYRTIEFQTMGFGPEDFVDLDGDKRLELVQTAFVYAESNDGQTHSYWVHRILEFRKGKLSARACVDPVFVQFTFRRPNRRPTQKLTRARQRALIVEEALFAEPGGCSATSRVMDHSQGGVWRLYERNCWAVQERRFEVVEQKRGASPRRILYETRSFASDPYAWADLIDFERDGQPEVVIRGGCGIGPNCRLDYYRRQDEHQPLQLFFSATAAEVKYETGHLVAGSRAGCCGWVYRGYVLEPPPARMREGNPEWLIDVRAPAGQDQRATCAFFRRQRDTWAASETPAEEWRRYCEHFGPQYDVLLGATYADEGEGASSPNSQ